MPLKSTEPQQQQQQATPRNYLTPPQVVVVTIGATFLGLFCGLLFYHVVGESTFGYLMYYSSYIAIPAVGYWCYVAFKGNFQRKHDFEARARSAAREKVLFAYSRHAARINRVFTPDMLEEALRKEMGDNLPLEEVEKNGKKLSDRLERIVLRTDVQEFYEERKAFIQDHIPVKLFYDTFLIDTVGDHRTNAEVLAACERMKADIELHYQDSPERRRQEQEAQRTAEVEQLRRRAEEMGMTETDIQEELRRMQPSSPDAGGYKSI